jgi:group I intron endonuclease
MKSITYEAFVYCWTDKRTNKLYVGSHKGLTDDGYICSSKYMLEEYNKRPKDFSRQIVAEGEYENIRILEEKILTTVNAKLDENFYNMHNGDGKFYLKGHTEKARKAISIANTGRIRQDLSERNKLGLTKEQIQKQIDTKRKMGYYLPENNPMFGKTHSEKIKKKHSERMSGEKNPNYNKKFSKETKEKMSIARKLYWKNRKEGIVNGD